MVGICCKVIYGSWNYSSSIYKDSKGFHVVHYDIKKQAEYKKYLKG
jgi:hypothetical protein